MMLPVCHVLLCWLCISNAYYGDYGSGDYGSGDDGAGDCGYLPNNDMYMGEIEGTSTDYSCYNNGLTAFPSSDIHNSTTTIDVFKNNISAFEHDIFTNYPNLTSLDLGKNPFTELPNLRPVGKTLLFLYCYESQLSFIDPEMFSELIVLEWVDFAYSKLTSFPNVAGPANTLYYIDLQFNQLMSTPCLDKYTALIFLYLDNNPIIDSGVDPCVAVTTVSTDAQTTPEQTTPEAYITNFTDVSMRQLEDLTVISVPSEMTTVPLTCPRHDVSIVFSGPDPAVSLCTCDNVWLKAVDGQRGSLDMADKTCGAAVTTQQLLQQECQRPRTGRLTMMNLEKSYANFFCSFPIAKYLTNVSVQRCGMVCIKTLGCSGFNFRETARPMFGDCAIVAPTDSAITDIPDQDSPEWTYWTERK